MEIEFLKDWKFAERGIHIIDFKRGEIREVSDECGELALSLGVGKLKAAKPKASSKDAGKEKQQPSSQAAPVSRKQTRKKRKTSKRS